MQLLWNISAQVDYAVYMKQMLLASSGKGYNGEDVDSIEMIGEPNITVEENE